MQGSWLKYLRVTGEVIFSNMEATVGKFQTNKNNLLIISSSRILHTLSMCKNHL